MIQKVSWHILREWNRVRIPAETSILSQDDTLSSFYRLYKNTTSWSKVTLTWNLTTQHLLNIKVFIIAYSGRCSFFYIPENPWWYKYLSEYVRLSGIVFQYQMIRPVPKFTTKVLKITHSSGTGLPEGPNMSILLNG